MRKELQGQKRKQCSHSDHQVILIACVSLWGTMKEERSLREKKRGCKMQRQQVTIRVDPRTWPDVARDGWNRHVLVGYILLVWVSVACARRVGRPETRCPCCADLTTRSTRVCLLVQPRNRWRHMCKLLPLIVAPYEVHTFVRPQRSQKLCIAENDQIYLRNATIFFPTGWEMLHYSDLIQWMLENGIPKDIQHVLAGKVRS